MNPLLFLAFVVSAASGIGWWQQHSIDRVRGDIARLAQEIGSIRAASETDLAALTEVRSQLDFLKLSLQAQAETQRLKGTTAAPTPADKGWWPQDQPYFYLAKSLLPLVRFRDRTLSLVEIDPHIRDQMATNNWSAPEVTYQLFLDDKLNPHLALLLGMNTEETVMVNDLWGALLRDAEALEVARLERVDPPQQTEQAAPGQLLVARLPGLSSEIEPLLKQQLESLQQILGPSRTAILQEHTVRYADEHLDGFGSLQREFLYQNGTLWVRYVKKQGNRSFSYQTRGVGRWNNFGKYQHLFGAGAPFELK